MNPPARRPVLTLRAALAATTLAAAALAAPAGAETVPGLRVMLLSRYVDGVLLGRMQPGWRALSKRAKQVELAAAIGKLVAR